MSNFIKTRIMIGCIVVLLLAGVIAWIAKMAGVHSHEEAPAYRPTAVVQPVSVETKKNVFAAEEEQREVYLEQQREAQELAKKKTKKEKSPECQFWRLQQAQGKSPVAAKKVEQHCILQDEEIPVKL